MWVSDTNGMGVKNIFIKEYMKSHVSRFPFVSGYVHNFLVLFLYQYITMYNRTIARYIIMIIIINNNNNMLLK